MAEGKPSALYEKHVRLTDRSRLVPFGGYLMPLWYSSISEEHRAVREAAGLFDCTHMGVLEVSGPEAQGFLDFVTANDVKGLGQGKARYSFFLAADGEVLDDIIIYRRGAEKFMVVVNAANEPKIKDYLAALLAGKAVIDAEEPERKLTFCPEIVDLRDLSMGESARVDLALQGPVSLDVLSGLIKEREVQNELEGLKSFHFMETVIKGIEVIISRTGYTGAKVGYELFAHPERAGELWDQILSRGEALGVRPCGLGARDSLRIEAGLPLYGHELAGGYELSPYEAGYGWAVKLEKEYFIGKRAMAKLSGAYRLSVCRLELPGDRGVRPVREKDAVLNGDGACIGWVLSCAKAEDKQVALACVEREEGKEGESVGIYYAARNRRHVQNP